LLILTNTIERLQNKPRLGYGCFVGHVTLQFGPALLGAPNEIDKWCRTITVSAAQAFDWPHPFLRLCCLRQTEQYF
jgi:hypothetical protein